MKEKRSTIYTQTGCDAKAYKLLMVDDSKTFNQKVTDALREIGHEVVQSYTLKDTVQLIENEDFDFILLDLILPDGEGDEVLDLMPDEQRAKVIVLSADTDIQRRSHIYSSGILEYFSKSNPTHLIIQDIKNLLCNIEKNKYVNVLTVDDSAFMRRLIKGLLSPKKYNILEAKNGLEALDILNENEIHLMLCDLEMPEMDGAQLVETVKSKVKFSELPIIMISSKDDKATIARVLKHGAKDFIKKPFSTEEFLLKCDLHVQDHMRIEYIKTKDIELQATLKRAQEAEYHKSLFLANMSHEIRTPLNAIIGFVNLLLEDETDEQKLNYLKTVQKGGDHLLSLINDILDFSKIESNKLDIIMEAFSLEELSSLMVSLNAHKAKEKNVHFKSIVDKNLPKYLKSDFLRIKQVLTNLIGNAIKFTPENGDVTLEIKLSRNKKFIEFSVSDTGIGIAPENHKKVFQLFSQAESTTSKKFGGTGLGLSISAKLVELLGGQISIDSQLHEGAKFCFNIPIVEFKDDEIVHHESVDNKKDKTKEIKFENHILLVEDNKTNQKLMSIILKKLGFTFDLASDGIEAVESYKKGGYDLLLMDENMPNMNGSEATKLIRQYEKEQNLKHTPIIALTANAIKGDKERFLEAGMDEYLAKPIDRRALTELLTQFLLKNTKEEEPFMIVVKKAFKKAEEALLDEKFDEMAKYINLIKVTTRKYNFDAIFKLSAEIEKYAVQKDLQGCQTYIYRLKELI